MLTDFHIQFLKCFRTISVPLKPLTVLIGPNNTGKSSFLSAVSKLFSRDASLQPPDRWRGSNEPFRIIASMEDGGALDLSQRHVPNEGLTDSLGPVLFLRLTPGGVPMTCAGQPDGAGPPSIQPDGGGVPALLDFLLRRDRDRYDDFVNAMKKLVPGLETVNVLTPSKETRGITLTADLGYEMRAEYSSDGVQLMLFFVAISYHPSPPGIILLEEPENGVHPKRLGDIVRLLRSITKGEHCGRPAQVILTTHSPYLLDCIDPKEDQVLVFERGEKEGNRTAKPVDLERLQDFLSDFRLGEIWYNREEGELTKEGQPT